MEMERLESKFLHQQINSLIDLEAVKIVGIALESHEKSSEGNERREAA